MSGKLKKFHSAKPLHRTSVLKREPKPKILIVCEGKVTEPTYFERFRQLHGNGLVDIKAIGGCGVPVSVVERAIEEQEKLRYSARKMRDSFEALFEVWAVFDRDEHPIGQVERAFELAAGNDISVAYSNPCFEVWGLMHFSCYSRPGHHKEVQTELKRSLRGYCHDDNPIIDPTSLEDKYIGAVGNARRAIGEREREGAIRGDPSTNVFELTERIRLFGRK